MAADREQVGLVKLGRHEQAGPASPSRRLTSRFLDAVACGCSSGRHMPGWNLDHWCRRQV